MSDITTQTPLRRMDAIRRTTPPETTNGSRWEVQLSAAPPREWLELFKLAGQAAAGPASRRVVFDGASAVFKCDEEQVAQWIESLDAWIAWTEARYVLSLEAASLERSTRRDAEAKERERIQQLNDRFKNL